MWRDQTPKLWKPKRQDCQSQISWWDNHQRLILQQTCTSTNRRPVTTSIKISDSQMPSRTKRQISLTKVDLRRVFLTVSLDHRPTRAILIKTKLTIWWIILRDLTLFWARITAVSDSDLQPTLASLLKLQELMSSHHGPPWKLILVLELTMKIKLPIMPCVSNIPLRTLTLLTANCTWTTRLKLKLTQLFWEFREQRFKRRLPLLRTPRISMRFQNRSIPHCQASSLTTFAQPIMKLDQVVKLVHRRLLTVSPQDKRRAPSLNYLKIESTSLRILTSKLAVRVKLVRESLTRLLKKVPCRRTEGFQSQMQRSVQLTKCGSVRFKWEALTPGTHLHLWRVDKFNKSGFSPSTTETRNRKTTTTLSE